MRTSTRRNHVHPCRAVPSRSEVSRRDHGCGFGVDDRTDPQLLLDLLLDLRGHIRVLTEVVAGVLLALTELVTLVRVPRTGLADDALLDPDVDQRALATDPLAVHDVEF